MTLVEKCFVDFVSLADDVPCRVEGGFAYANGRKVRVPRRRGRSTFRGFKYALSRLRGCEPREAYRKCKL